MLELDFSQTLGSLELQVSQTLPAQGITAIFGLSGAGKTSLINAIGGLTQPDSGRITLNGRILSDKQNNIFLPPEKRRVGYVFQDARLFPHYRVKGNLQYGMAPSMRGQFDNIVRLLGITPLLDRFPLTLSGGEKQRVAIGRALLTAPEILLMDEPLAALDIPRKRELMPYLERLAQEVSIPILYVTHSLDEILRLAEKVLVLDGGKVLAMGTLEDVWASNVMRPWLPKEEQSSVLNVSVLEHHPRYEMTALAIGDQRLWISKVEEAPGTALRIRVNSTDVSLVLQPTANNSSIRNILPAKVLECLDLGNQVEVKLAMADHIIWARISPWARDELMIRAGQWLYAQIKSVSVSR
ncbi:MULTISPECIES: molybdenum ABC transporter ATP-binding protein ModC [Rahnella]|jgi:molybdate transport system ATP-binding protein|uniref:Molybdenum ABC transporter ATP-binding protein ModC n=2 Tax=Rahnella TaxID=34037 RepID=A0ABW6CDI8_RAHSY|nr:MULTISPECIES: molybdenum ABC transporter ATP-binding protein ModC [Rahnella]AFE59351.1 molybdate transporter ATP-binding protein [Rahnella aquatilis HX2]AYA07923.1 molybdenum ABC transporter ATP-binding protein ModC [Rahnella aquatilis]AZP51932.1 molybdenum ABC transporter ATP-binding protein ModC [Rahnella aquatilis]MDP9703903.1 molybdate transport system ATP-binding protein [Rahnella aquatilis]UNK53605.1 molybdenum ABC transporter ATP-binding protein ModC [Rahnella aceris]